MSPKQGKGKQEVRSRNVDSTLALLRVTCPPGEPCGKKKKDVGRKGVDSKHRDRQNMTDS